jgi:CheY-like chemotaxis protein
MASTEQSGARFSPGGHLVLVVDDDFGLRESLCAALEEEGFAVAGAGNGREALDYLRRESHRQHSPSVVLLDLMMPVMNGWEFRAEQERDPDIASIPVVILSAFARATDEELRGIETFLRKPVDMPTLLEALRPYCA